MRYAKYLYLIWSLCLLIGASSCNTDKSSLGELRDEERDVIVRNGNQDFNKKRWAKTEPELRGQMTASLLRGQRFVGKKNTDVFQLLGERTCYIDYEDQPCYELILDNKWHYLVFRVNHSNAPGKITDILIVARD